MIYIYYIFTIGYLVLLSGKTFLPYVYQEHIYNVNQGISRVQMSFVQVVEMTNNFVRKEQLTCPCVSFLTLACNKLSVNEADRIRVWNHVFVWQY